MQVDQQTLFDLEIISKDSANPGLIDLFEKPQTTGGFEKLKNTLLSPRQDVSEIIKMQNALKFILKDIPAWEMQIDDKLALNIEKYLRSNIMPVATFNRFKLFWEKYRYRSVYFLLKQYVIDARTLLFEIKSLANRIKLYRLPELIQTTLQSLECLWADENIQNLLKTNDINLKATEVLVYDKIFRHSLKDALKLALDQFYQIDAFIAMTKTIKAHQFVFPEFTDSNSPTIEIIGLFHPFLKNPKPANIEFHEKKNFLFLTGPNMSGKTTFIKAFGIAVYLAHVGMAVPASQMRLSYFDALMTNINTEDNIRLGYSYFFSEVKRVREIAQQLNQQKKTIILSDELFKGTNIHDAYEASRLVIKGFMNWKKSIFILSTHLVELESEVAKFTNTFCKHFEITVIDEKPGYTYQLINGTSHKRSGLLILQQEDIIDLLTPEAH